MNIKEAKEEIKNALTAYITKNKFGNYIIPIEKQRPIILMGPPGIGKTAIVEQISTELGIGLLSYSMTHHTRQSALGLPLIEHKTYNGVEYDISEYTMSEIIASVYDLMEKTGVKEGILFLDEINCVSETLAPVMLQFLQYKVFGRHRLPDGWIVVTAGNPPEYNNSVREFDIVTWDRLKRIDIEPNFEIWKEYAYRNNIHASILSYLEVKLGDFYSIKSTVDGKSFITARGWEDLSQMIQLYELNGIEVKGKLISQYIQNDKIAKSFAAYYDLFNKYRNDYQIDRIIAGNIDNEIISRAQSAELDERLALISLLLEAINNETKKIVDENSILDDYLEQLKKFKNEIQRPNQNSREIMNKVIDNIKTTLEKGEQAGYISADRKFQIKSVIEMLEEQAINMSNDTKEDAFIKLKKDYDQKLNKINERATKVSEKLSNMFKFLERVFPDGQELLIVVTELTANYYSAKFINKYGSKEYFNHNKELLFYERQLDIIEELEELKI